MLLVSSSSNDAQKRLEFAAWDEGYDLDPTAGFLIDSLNWVRPRHRGVCEFCVVALRIYLLTGVFDHTSSLTLFLSDVMRLRADWHRYPPRLCLYSQTIPIIQYLTNQELLAFINFFNANDSCSKAAMWFYDVFLGAWAKRVRKPIASLETNGIITKADKDSTKSTCFVKVIEEMCIYNHKRIWHSMMLLDPVISYQTLIMGNVIAWKATESSSCWDDFYHRGIIQKRASTDVCKPSMTL